MRVLLAMPLRPRNGIHEIMRMMFEVQNGIVQTRNSAICIVSERTWKARKYATVKPISIQNSHVRNVYFSVLR
jgi:hypothetical protein